MPKANIPFDDFVQAAGDKHLNFITNLHNFMAENECRVDIKQAASGHVVSYIHTPSKRTVANYVFRKNGLMMRIYADNVSSYMEILSNWPVAMKDTIKKSGVCKRLINPEACNQRCLMGFDFILDGERYQKCRNGSFMFFIDDETKPHIRKMMEHEMQERRRLTI